MNTDCFYCHQYYYEDGKILPNKYLSFPPYTNKLDEENINPPGLDNSPDR
jgi:hypothetical protein